MKPEGAATLAVFDTPVDGLYAWVGLTVASAALVGVAVGLPTAPPPDAAGLADTVDRTAASEYTASATHPVDAESVRLTPERVGLRNDAGTVHAEFVYGPVTPVAGAALRAVLDGAPPSRVFASPGGLQRAVAAARERDHEWRHVDGPIVVRHVVWEGEHVTLVGS